jgi:hypothetical protein
MSLIHANFFLQSAKIGVTPRWRTAPVFAAKNNLVVSTESKCTVEKQGQKKMQSAALHLFFETSRF